jgi:hypothetical protein
LASALVAWLALVLANVVVLQPADVDAYALAGLFGADAICHSDIAPAAPTPKPGTPHPHHSCPLCPICAAHAQLTPLHAKPLPALRAPVMLGGTEVYWWPPQAGPPPQSPGPVQPRAPPLPI